jgi:hypothetical protein
MSAQPPSCSPLWGLLRGEYQRELRARESFVTQLERDPSLSKTERRRRVWGAIRERDRARARLRFVETAMIWNVPVPSTELGKSIALARHFHRSAMAAAYSGDRSAARDWSKRRRAILQSTMSEWTHWNCHSDITLTKTPACAGDSNLVKVDGASAMERIA